MSHQHSRVFFEAGVECNERAAAKARAEGRDPSKFDTLVEHYRQELSTYDKPKGFVVVPTGFAVDVSPRWLENWVHRASRWLMVHTARENEHRIRLRIGAPVVELAYDPRIKIEVRSKKNDRHINVYFPEGHHQRALSLVQAAI